MIKNIIKYKSIGIKDNQNVTHYEISDDKDNRVNLIFFNFGKTDNMLCTIRFSLNKISNGNFFELGYDIYLSDYKYMKEEIELYELIFSDSKKEILNLIIKAQSMIGLTKTDFPKMDAAYKFLNEIYKEIDCYA